MTINPIAFCLSILLGIPLGCWLAVKFEQRGKVE